jgi:hypothetical protein
LVRKGLNQQKMARDIDFRARGGRESLWNTGEKTEFSRVHCEVPYLDFSFRGLKPTPLKTKCGKLLFFQRVNDSFSFPGNFFRNFMKKELFIRNLC